MLKPSSRFFGPGKTGKNIINVFHYVQQVFQETFLFNKILFTSLFVCTGALTRNINISQSNKKRQVIHNPCIFTSKFAEIKSMNNGNNGIINMRYG